MAAWLEYVLNLAWDLLVFWPWGGSPPSGGSHEWPLTRAQVREATMRTVDTMYGREYIADITYAFEVRGRIYTGRHEPAFKDDLRARELINQARSGGTVMVRYRPKHPKFSVVLDADNDELWGRKSVPPAEAGSEIF